MRVTDLPADRLRRDGLRPSSWSNAPGHRYWPHRHGYDKVIIVERGSITFGLRDHQSAVELAEGDRLELPAGTAHGAVVGPAGVTCLEAHLPPGSFAAVRRLAAGQ